MKIRPTIDIKPCGPGKRYCEWTRGEGLLARKSECKWHDRFCGWCALFEVHTFRDDRNRVVRCPQCVAAEADAEAAEAKVERLEAELADLRTLLERKEGRKQS